MKREGIEQRDNEKEMWLLLSLAADVNKYRTLATHNLLTFSHLGDVSGCTVCKAVGHLSRIWPAFLLFHVVFSLSSIGIALHPYLLLSQHLHTRSILSFHPAGWQSLPTASALGFISPACFYQLIPTPLFLSRFILYSQEVWQLN